MTEKIDSEELSYAEIKSNRLIERTKFLDELGKEYYRTRDPEVNRRWHFESAKFDLYDKFDIDKLSAYEAIRLRKLVEESMQARTGEEEILEKEKDADPFSMPDTENEAIAHWLLELYNINQNDFPIEYEVYEYMTGKILGIFPTRQEGEDFQNSLGDGATDVVVLATTSRALVRKIEELRYPPKG